VIPPPGRSLYLGLPNITGADVELLEGLPCLVDFKPVSDEMDSKSPFSPVDSVKGSIAAGPQLEQALPLASQRLRRYGIEMLSQPTELVENPLGYRFI